MDSKKILHDHTVDRYVYGHLTEKETAGFETRFLDQPEIIEQIEISQSFKVAVQAMTKKHIPRWQRFFSLQGSSGWVAAFATMAFVVGGQIVR